MGAIVEEAAPEIEGDPFPAFSTVFGTASYTSYADLYPERREELTHYVRNTFDAASQHTAADLSRALAYVDRHKRRFADFFNTYDLLLTPAMAVTAFPIGQHPTSIAGPFRGAVVGLFALHLPHQHERADGVQRAVRLLGCRPSGGTARRGPGRRRGPRASRHGRVRGGPTLGAPPTARVMTGLRDWDFVRSVALRLAPLPLRLAGVDVSRHSCRRGCHAPVGAGWPHDALRRGHPPAFRVATGPRPGIRPFTVDARAAADRAGGRSPQVPGRYRLCSAAALPAVRRGPDHPALLPAAADWRRRIGVRGGHSGLFPFPALFQPLRTQRHPDGSLGAVAADPVVAVQRVRPPATPVRRGGDNGPDAGHQGNRLLRHPVHGPGRVGIGLASACWSSSAGNAGWRWSAKKPGAARPGFSSSWQP